MGLQSYTNERNIYLLQDTTNLSFGRKHDRLGGADFHNNLYWSMASENDKTLRLFPNSTKNMVNWQEWQDYGLDSHSLWQDPLFADAANHRYNLRSGSSATSLGIKQVRLGFIPNLEKKTKSHRVVVLNNAKFFKTFINKK